MNYEEDESAICLYIDELKSDDQSLKMNAVDKVSLICQHLSEKRVCNEFFPYLRYIIQECDNEDEFLIRLSMNLTSYLQGLGGSPDVLTSSVQVYETMVVMEDPRVRDSAIKGFRFLGNFIFNKVAEMILKLGTSDLQYGKMSCCNLIRVTIQDKTFREDMFPHCSKICLLLLEDHSMLVKRAALNALRFMWDSPNRSFPENELTVFSPKFLEKISGKYLDLDDDGLVYELLHRDFFSRFLLLNDFDQRVHIQIGLIKKFLFFLKKSHLQKLTENMMPPEEQMMSSVDQTWKVKYMICQNFSLLLSGLLSPSFFSTFLTQIRLILQEYPLLSGVICDSPKEGDSLEEAWRILSEFIYVVYRNYICNEMVEVKSVFLSQLILFCETIQNENFKIKFFIKLLDIFNEYVLYDESFYVKMKTASFLNLLTKVIVQTPTLAQQNLTFSKLSINGSQENLLVKIMNQQNPISQNLEQKEEPKPFSINEQIAKNTSINCVDLTNSALIEHAISLFFCLSLDPSIEIYKAQLNFLKRAMELSPQSSEILQMVNDIVLRMKTVPSNKNIKYRRHTAEFLGDFVSKCKSAETLCYLQFPLLPLNVPKNIKSETQLITLTGRSHSRQNTELNTSEEVKINKMNIKFALSTMYKGYLVTLRKQLPDANSPHLFSKNNKNHENLDFPEISSKKILNDLIDEPKDSEKHNMKSRFPLEEAVLSSVEETLFGFAEDVTAVVRNQTIEAFTSFAHILPKGKFEKLCENLLRQWTSHKSYMFRISAIHFLAILALIPDFALFGKFFGNVIRNGLKEKVVNVKLCLLRLVGLINQLLPQLTRNNHQLKIMLDFFEGDVDKNVARIAGIIQNSFQNNGDFN
jgi:hypothetical protein